METPRKVYVGVAAYALLLAFVLSGFMAIVWVEGNHRDDQRRENRFAVCQEIENLKADSRREAWKSFNDLNKNLRLLGIRKTPEIAEAARLSRDAKLDRFAPNDCAAFAAGATLE